MIFFFFITIIDSYRKMYSRTEIYLVKHRRRINIEDDLKIERRPWRLQCVAYMFP